MAGVLVRVFVFFASTSRKYAISRSYATPANPGESHGIGPRKVGQRVRTPLISQGSRVTAGVATCAGPTGQTLSTFSCRRQTANTGYPVLGIFLRRFSRYSTASRGGSTSLSAFSLGSGEHSMLCRNPTPSYQIALLREPSE
jgi:hypothetical protein